MVLVQEVIRKGLRVEGCSVSVKVYRGGSTRMSGKKT